MSAAAPITADSLDPLLRRLLQANVIHDELELHEVLREAEWLNDQAELTASLPLRSEDIASAPELELQP